MENSQPYHHGNLRVALLAAAELELNEKGLEAFSLRGVAKKAGVSHNAPSHHFSDVNGLLTALATVGFQRLVRTQTNRQDNADPDPMEQFIALGLGYVEFATENPAMFRLMFSSRKPDRANSELMAAMISTLEKLSETARRAINADNMSGQVDNEDLIAAWAMVHGLADLTNSGLLDHLRNSTKPDRHDVLKEVLRRLDFASRKDR